MESPTGVSSSHPASPTSCEMSSPLSLASSRAAHAFLASLRAAFQPAAVSSLSSARSRERSALESFLKRTLQARRGGAIYVTGAPGTGKTMLVTSILARYRALCRDDGAGAAGDTEEAAELLAPHSAAAAAEAASIPATACDRCPSFRLVWLNAMTQADRGVRLTTELEADAKAAKARAQARGRDSDDNEDSDSDNDCNDACPDEDGEGGAASRRRTRFRSSARGEVTTVLVVDEVDQLLLRSKSIILRLFSAPLAQSSRLVVIGIANKVSLTTDETLPLLTTAGAAPEVVVFSPYERDSLVAIANHRVDTAAAAAVAMTASEEASLLNTEKGSRLRRKRPAPSSDVLTVTSAAAATAGTASAAAMPAQAASLSAAARRLVFDPDALRMCAMAVARANGDARLFLGYCQDALVAAAAGAKAARCPWAVDGRRKAVAAAAAAAVSAARAESSDDDGIVESHMSEDDNEDENASTSNLGTSCTCIAGILWQTLLTSATQSAPSAAAVPSPLPSPVASAPSKPAPLPAGLPLVPFRAMSEVVARAQADKDVAPLVANLPRAQLTLLLVLALAEAFQVEGVVGAPTSGGVFAKKSGEIMRGLSLPSMTAVAIDETLELLRCSGAVDVSRLAAPAPSSRGSRRDASSSSSSATAAAPTLSVTLNVSLGDVLESLDKEEAFGPLVARVRGLVAARRPAQ